MIVLSTIGYAEPVEQTVLPRETVLAVRVLAYDRELGPAPLRIAVVAPPGSSAGQVVEAQLARLQGVAVGRTTLADSGRIDFRPDVDWTSALAPWNVAILCPGVGPDLTGVVAAAAQLDVRLISLDGYRAARGAAITVYPSGSRLLVGYDPANAAAQGAVFSAELLEIVTRDAR